MDEFQKILDKHAGAAQHVLDKRLKERTKFSLKDRGLISPAMGYNPLVSDDRNRTTNLFVLPSNIPQLDLILPIDSEKKRRGFAAGKYHMFTGDANTYKSTLFARLQINLLNEPIDQRMFGAHVYHLEVNHNWELDWFQDGKIAKINNMDDAAGRYHHRSISTFTECFNQCKEILLSWKEILFKVISDYNSTVRLKTDRLEPQNLYLPLDVCPVAIFIEDFSNLFSDTSADNDLSETKVAEDNSDVHRMMKLFLPLMRFLGIPIFINNHYRDPIKESMMNKNARRRPFLWKSMQGYLNTAFDFSVYSKDKQVKGEKVYYLDEISLRIRKLKGDTTFKGFIPPIHFHKRYGFDIGHGCLEVLKVTGFMEGEETAIVINEYNSNGDRLPKPLRKYIGIHAKNDFFTILKLDLEYFTKALMISLTRMTPSWIPDSRDINPDSVLYAKTEEAEEEDSEDTEDEEIEKDSLEIDEEIAEIETDDIVIDT